MLLKELENNREQCLFLVVIYIMAALFVAGLALKEMNFQYYDISRGMADLHESMYWKYTPGL